MNKVTIEKEKLLDKLKTNRAEHASEYKEARAKYQSALILKLEAKLEQAKSGSDVELYIDLVKPVEYLSAYDRAISMLEVTLDTNIELTPEQFAQFWLDEWNWRGQYYASNSMYSETVAMKAGALR